jgi:hypothetical protein
MTAPHHGTSSLKGGFSGGPAFAVFFGLKSQRQVFHAVLALIDAGVELELFAVDVGVAPVIGVLRISLSRYS